MQRIGYGIIMSGYICEQVEWEELSKKDQSMMKRARENEDRSTCLKHPLGSVLVTIHDEVIDGWNGAPGQITCKQRFGECPRKKSKSGRKMEVCPSVHAERKGILKAAKAGFMVRGATLYCWCGIPCKDCVIEILEAQVRKIVCLNDDKFERKQPTSYNFNLAALLLMSSNIEVVLVKVKESDLNGRKIKRAR
jgi:deoxycytidylate deaminase